MADWPLFYMHEKIDQAIGNLILTEDPEAIAGAFEILGRIRGENSAGLNDERALEWWATIQSLTQPSEGDRAAAEDTYVARARRLTKDDKLELSNCLLELQGYLTEEYYRHYGDD